jgi:hypothetical protein
MKSAAQTKKQPSKPKAKAAPATRANKPARPAPAERPQPAAPARPTASPVVAMPDLTGFGVDADAARAHVAQCEECGRAHRHVVKNPKDAMALDSFGRHIAVCLAGKRPAA